MTAFDTNLTNVNFYIQMTICNVEGVTLSEEYKAL